MYVFYLRLALSMRANCTTCSGRVVYACSVGVGVADAFVTDTDREGMYVQAREQFDISCLHPSELT